MSATVSILGAQGMLGSDLAPLLESEGYNVRRFDLPECDITQPLHLEQAAQGAGMIVNCAAFTNVDGAEAAPDRARAVNALAVGALGKLAAARDIFVVHISTDFVFSGVGTSPYTETDRPEPLSVYGKTKLEGEALLGASGCRHVVLRVQWSYGANGSNFISKLISRADSGAELKIVADQIGAPTWTAEMARAILCLLRRQPDGIFHFAAGGYASRYEVGRLIVRELKLANHITPCVTADFPAPAARPLNSRFNTARIRALLDFPVRPWEMALTEFLRAQYL